MSTPIAAAGIARALNALTYAGPQTSPITAQGIAARLEKAAAWSNPRLARLSGLPEAEAVAASEVLILDRHGLTSRVARAFDEIAPIGSVRQIGVRVFVLRSLATSATGLWDPTRRVRVLVAPNVLADAHRYSLDQGDWCKWVALKAGLAGVLLTRAPFLVETGLDADEFMRRILLSESLVNALMRAIGPRELSSVEWLRHHGPEDSVIALVARAASAFEDPGSLLENHRLFARFAEHTVRSGRLDALLASPAALPSAAELADPEAWTARVG